MSRCKRTLLSMFVLVPLAGLSAGELVAQEAPEMARWGVGWQGTFPAHGLSAQYHLNEEMTAQAILGALGTVTSLAGRGLYRFQREPSYDLYGYGAVGAWHWSGGRFFPSQTTFGIGAGAGAEVSLQQLIDETLPPIFTSIELGFTIADFDHYNFNAFTLGMGIHYRF